MFEYLLNIYIININYVIINLKKEIIEEKKELDSYIIQNKELLDKINYQVIY